MKIDSYNHLLSLIEKASDKIRDNLIALAMEKYGWSAEWVEYHLACRAGRPAQKPLVADYQPASAS